MSGSPWILALAMYLPPTMSPVAASERTGLLKATRPRRSTAYRSAGVRHHLTREEHMGSRCVTGLSSLASGTAPQVRRSTTGSTAPRTPGLAARSSSRAHHRLLNGYVGALERRRIRRTGPPLGAPDAELLPGARRPKISSATIRDGQAAARAALPAAIQALEQAAADGRTWASCWTACDRVRRTRVPSPRPTAATAGRSAAWTASSWPPSRCLRPRRRPSMTGITGGTCGSPTGWPPPTRSCSWPPGT